MVRRVLLALIVLLAVAAGAVYWFFSGDGMRRALERQASAWLGQPVAIASATARVFPRIGVQLRNVRVGKPARLSLADVEVSTGLRALLSRRVEDAELIVSNSRIALPLPFAIPTTETTPAAQSPSTAFTVASIREITLSDVRVASRGREILVSATSSLAGDRLTIDGFTARSGATAVNARGVVDLAPRIDAKLEAAANRLDLDDLMALADAFTPEQSTRRSGPAFAGRIEAKLTAAEGTAAGVQMKKLAANVVARGNHVTLSPMSFEVFGGTSTATLEAELGTLLSVALNARINALDVAQLAAFGNSAGTITGRLTGEGRLTGRGRDFAGALANASGSGTAAIADGTMRGLQVVRTVVLFFGRPASDAPASGGERFERMATNFTLARQVLRAESLTLESQDFDVAAAGSLTIPSKALEGRGNLLLSEALSAQAGTDLVRFTREGNRVVLPALIGGTIAAPRVTIDAAAAARRGLRNEVERRMKGIFDRFKPPPQ
jgi:uncharacterized protein involved in outer membrane biogenesis